MEEGIVTWCAFVFHNRSAPLIGPNGKFWLQSLREKKALIYSKY